MTTHLDLGAAGEAHAARYLEEADYRIVDRNWRCDVGELDIVAVLGRELVFIEVKTRRSLDFGDPLTAVDQRKRNRLWKLVWRWVAEHRVEATGRAIRLDVIGLVGEGPTFQLEHVRDLR